MHSGGARESNQIQHGDGVSEVTSGCMTSSRLSANFGAAIDPWTGAPLSVFPSRTFAEGGVLSADHAPRLIRARETSLINKPECL